MSGVDIVVPCYNYARYLRACVHSVLSQTGVDVRVLVIDDASTDATAAVGRSLAAAYPRQVEFRRHAVNRGHIATYNEGLLDWSTADYTVLLSADDLLTPGALSRAAGIMDRNPEIGLVFGRPVCFRDEAEIPPVPAVAECRFLRWRGRHWLEDRCRRGRNIIASPEAVVRGRVQRAVGGYRPELPHAGDLEMWLRIAAVADVAFVRGFAQAGYRGHGANMSSTSQQGILVDLTQRRAAFASFFRHHPLADGERLHGLARRALAGEALWTLCRAYDRGRLAETPAAALLEFALATCPEARRLAEYRALRRRRRLGPALCQSGGWFAPAALVRDLSERLDRWTWWQCRRWQLPGTGRRPAESAPPPATKPF